MGERIIDGVQAAQHNEDRLLLQHQEGQQQRSRLHASKEPAVVLVYRRVRMLLAAVGSEGRARSSVHDRSSSRKKTVRYRVKRRSLPEY